MNKFFHRLIALLLIPCLVADPAMSVSLFNSLVPLGERAEVRGNVDSSFFSREALAASAIEQWHTFIKQARVWVMKNRRGLPFDETQDPYLKRWGLKFRSALKEHGFKENEAYYDLLETMQKDVMAAEGLTENSRGLASMMEMTRYEHANDGTKLNILPVTPKTIMMCMAQYVLQKSLTHDFLKNDMADLLDLIHVYNATPGVPYLLDRPSLFVICMTPFFRDTELFARMYQRLADIPGEEGEIAAGLALLLAGAHRDSAEADAPYDFRAYPKLLKRTLGTLRLGPASDEARLALRLGLARFLSFMAPFLIGRGYELDIQGTIDLAHPELMSPAEEVAQRLREIEQLIAEYIEEIPPWIMSAEPKINPDESQVEMHRIIRLMDPALLGLSITFFSHIERLFEPAMKRTMTQVFLSNEDDVAELNLTKAIVKALFDFPGEGVEYLMDAKAIVDKFSEMLRALEEIKKRTTSPPEFLKPLSSSSGDARSLQPENLPRNNENCLPRNLLFQRIYSAA